MEPRNRDSELSGDQRAVLMDLLAERVVEPRIHRLDAAIRPLIDALQDRKRDLSAEHRRVRALMLDAAETVRLAEGVASLAVAERQYALLLDLDAVYSRERKLRARLRGERLLAVVPTKPRPPRCSWRRRRAARIRRRRLRRRPGVGARAEPDDGEPEPGFSLWWWRR